MGPRALNLFERDTWLQQKTAQCFTSPKPNIVNRMGAFGQELVLVFCQHQGNSAQAVLNVPFWGLEWTFNNVHLIVDENMRSLMR